jgi:PadR family transcriptional regulator PadR
MSAPLHQLKKGLTTLIVLDALKDGELYGYGLRREAFERTKGVFGFSEGALYPLLHSLEGKRLVKTQQRKVAGRWRTYYRITPKGRHTLTHFHREWQSLLTSLEAILQRRRRAR